jgi:hypothetical protein
VIHRGDILRAVGEYPVTNANDHHKSVIKKVMLSKFKVSISDIPILDT